MQPRPEVTGLEAVHVEVLRIRLRTMAEVGTPGIPVGDSLTDILAEGPISGGRLRRASSP